MKKCEKNLELELNDCTKTVKQLFRWAITCNMAIFPPYTTTYIKKEFYYSRIENKKERN